MATMCPYHSQHHGLPYCKGVLRCCDKYPGNRITHKKKNTDAKNTSSAINFHVYNNVSRCNVNGICPCEEQTICSMCYTDISYVTTGKVYTRKELVLIETSILKFHNKYYITSIKKLAFHLPHVRILGMHHFGKYFREAFKRRSRQYDVL